MRPIRMALVCGAALCLVDPAAAAQRSGALSPQAIENATPRSKAARGLDAATVRAEVLLDRAGFSPGVIDGHGGENFKKALAAFQSANGLDPTGRLDDATWGKLTQGAGQPVLADYEITAKDLKGPFVRHLPHRLEDMAKLPRLGYTSPREELAEKFHVSEDLLRQLNPGADFDKEGARIVVANVEPLGRRTKETSGIANAATNERANQVAARIEIRKGERAVRVFDRDGGLIAFFPASIGSADKPAPSGSFKITRISYDPTYHYDPKFHFKGVTAQRPFTVKPGPNNPVGSVWIDLSVPSYGIHGTPNPDKISKTQSHGCVRLTNGDALKLAGMVRRGTPVDFVEPSGGPASVAR